MATQGALIAHHSYPIAGFTKRLCAHPIGHPVLGRVVAQQMSDQVLTSVFSSCKNTCMVVLDLPERRKSPEPDAWRVVPDLIPGVPQPQPQSQRQTANSQLLQETPFMFTANSLIALAPPTLEEFAIFQRSACFVARIDDDDEEDEDEHEDDYEDDEAKDEEDDGVIIEDDDEEESPEEDDEDEEEEEEDTDEDEPVR